MMHAGAALTAVERVGEIAIVPLHADGLDLLPPDRQRVAPSLVKASLALDAADVVARGGEEAALRRQILAAVIARGDALHPKATSAIRAFAWRTWAYEGDTARRRRGTLNLPPGEFRSALRTVLRLEPGLLATGESESRWLDAAVASIYDPADPATGGTVAGAGSRAGEFASRAADCFEFAATAAPPEQAAVLRRAARALRSGVPEQAREALARAPDSRGLFEMAPDGSVTELDRVRTASLGDRGPRVVTALVAKGEPAGMAGLAWNLLGVQNALVHAPLAREFPGPDAKAADRAVRQGECAATALWIARARAARGGVLREVEACRLLADAGRRGETGPDAIAEAAASLVREWFTGRVHGGPGLIAAVSARGGVEMMTRDALPVPHVTDAARFFAAVDALSAAGAAGVPDGDSPAPALRERLLLAGVPEIMTWAPSGYDIASLLVP